MNSSNRESNLYAKTMTMSKANLLVVEDDKNLGLLLTEILQKDGFQVTLARNGKDGLHHIKIAHFDLCIFDIMVPDIDGFNLSKHLKNISPSTPFLFLTARMLKEDKLTGYNLGAEDYIVKPFDDEELLCKINVILRRKLEIAQENEQQKFEIGDYTFDYELMELIYDGVATRITEKESKVLRELCLQKNRILKRDEAVRKIYGKSDYFYGRSFDVFISKLRKLLSKDPKINIENVFKIGFILNVKEFD